MGYHAGVCAPLARNTLSVRSFAQRSAIAKPGGGAEARGLLSLAHRDAVRANQAATATSDLFGQPACLAREGRSRHRHTPSASPRAQIIRDCEVTGHWRFPQSVCGALLPARLVGGWVSCTRGRGSSPYRSLRRGAMLIACRSLRLSRRFCCSVCGLWIAANARFSCVRRSSDSVLGSRS